MKEIFYHIFSLVGALILVLMALAIVTALTPLALLWRIWISITNENRKAREILTGVKSYFISLAASVDKFGNCALGGFLNWALLIEAKYPFGNNGETVSEVLGWAEKYDDLNRKGLALLALLNMLDKNHCEKAYKSGVSSAYQKIQNYTILKTSNQ
jgi:hypothetical protein